MISSEKEQLRRDIEEAFTFVRFLIKNPKFVRKIRNGAEISILHYTCRKIPPGYQLSRNVQAFTTEAIFRSL